MKKALICMMQLHKNSGSARTAVENIQYFKKKGYEVHVASMTVDKNFIKAQGAIVQKMLPFIKSTGIYRRRWYNWQVQKLREKIKPNITIGHGDIQEQDVATLHNSVFLASELIHGKSLDENNEMFITHGDLLKNKKFKRLIANSDLMKQDCIRRFQIPAQDIHVVYPAIDTKTFYPDSSKRAQLRDRFKFQDKVVVALVTSGNFKKRGLDLFSVAIELLPQEIKNKASFRVIGKDTPGSNLSSELTFDPPLEDIENYYRAIDLFVLPARIEEFGRVVTEAMACGLPVITTDKVGAGELMEGESRKFVIPSHDTNALARALSEMISDSALRTRLGKLNAETAARNSIERVFAKFDEVFGELERNP